MTIDTEIRHVTKAGANLFLELGFSASEAKKLYAASRKQINDTRLLKQQLMTELSNWITEHQLRLVDAAQILMVSRPRVSDVVNQKTAKFTIDTLVEMLSRVAIITRAEGFVGHVSAFGMVIEDQRSCAPAAPGQSWAN